MLLGAKSLYILYISFTKLNLYMKNSESHFASLITSCEKPYRILAALRCKIYKELKLSLQLKPPHTGNANGIEEVSISHTVQIFYQAGQRGYESPTPETSRTVSLFENTVAFIYAFIYILIHYMVAQQCEMSDVGLVSLVLTQT